MVRHFPDTMITNLLAVVAAIYITEGSSNTKHPYGIIPRYINTTPKLACWNTVSNFCIASKAEKVNREFICKLGDKYCPPSCDPVGNKNWKRNMCLILHIVPSNITSRARELNSHTYATKTLSH